VAERGRLIVFEGGEASGKSTQAARLAKRLSATLTREPGGTPLGEALRPIVLGQSAGPIDSRTELLLMVAARAAHVASVIAPALSSGRDVVCDRFTASTIAYQGYGRGLALEDVLVACELATNGCDPDLNVLLDIDVATARLRRGSPDDAIEAAGAAFHGRVREGFLSLASADPARWVVLDAAMTPDDVEAAVASAIRERLPEVWR
jgi:dTMP kinase